MIPLEYLPPYKIFLEISIVPDSDGCTDGCKPGHFHCGRYGHGNVVAIENQYQEIIVARQSLYVL